MQKYFFPKNQNHSRITKMVSTGDFKHFEYRLNFSLIKSFYSNENSENLLRPVYLNIC